jgi:glutathione synthase/RimK-type ligase-like ATP-grasp enzyme
MLRGHPQLREDHWEHDREFDPLHAACATHGLDLQAVIWDDPALGMAQFDACVIGTAWDYTDQAENFLSTLNRFSDQVPLFNTLPAVHWNLKKTYLKELGERGVAVVPTLWRDRANESTIAGAFADLGVDEIVVKPVIGASAWRQSRIRIGDPLPPAADLPPAHAMIQPYLHAAANEGEFSFLFFDRQFSHCARKIPRDGDYRVQSMYGGREEVYHPSDAEMKVARQVLEAVPWPLLYARVDMMRGSDGRLSLMELELIEPYLYPDQGPGMGDAFADALKHMLNGSNGRI